MLSKNKASILLEPQIFNVQLVEWFQGLGIITLQTHKTYF